MIINKEISDEQKMSRLAIKNNYFKYLFEELDKYCDICSVAILILVDFSLQ